MIAWLAAVIWALASLVLGFWGLPALTIILLGALAGLTWKDMALEIAAQAGILQTQAQTFSKAPLVAIQRLSAETRMAVAYKLVFFAGVSVLSIALLFVALLFFKVHRHSPRTLANTVISVLLGAACGFVFFGTLCVALQLMGYSLGVPEYPVLQYFVSVLISFLA